MSWRDTLQPTGSLPRCRITAYIVPR